MTQLGNKDPEDQVAILITVIGLDALEVFETLLFAREKDKEDLKIILDLFEEHFVGKRNVIYERWLFNTRPQEYGEIFQLYVSTFRQVTRNCQFDTFSPDDILRVRIVSGIRD